MRHATPLALALAALLLVIHGAHAQPARVPTVTRLVKAFSELESTIDARLAAGDATALGAMLTDDFELRSAPSAGTPIARADWIKRAPTGAKSAVTNEQMAVHDYGPVAVVSFVKAGQARAAGRIFVVDVWQRDGESWKLATRYASSGAASPSLMSPAPTIEKRF